jgi:hypothetical protein
VEVSRLSNYLLLELVVVRVHAGFYEHDRGWTARAYDNTSSNQISTHRECIVFNGSMMVMW